VDAPKRGYLGHQTLELDQMKVGHAVNGPQLLG
jgi:hypothetical protein